MIKLENLSKIYELKNENVVAIDNLSIDIPEKGLVMLVGKSGCGKSTLLNILGGIDNFTSGKYYYDGKDMFSLTSSEISNFRKENIAFIFQDYNLIDEYNVGENIAVSLNLQGKNLNKDIIEKSLNDVDLEGYYGRKVRELSGGERQRVAIARAIAKECKLVLADEPTGNLDSVSSEKIFELLKDLSKDKLVIITTHDMKSAEMYSDMIIKLKDGKIEEIENILEIKDYTENSAIAFEKKRVRKGSLALNNSGNCIKYAVKNMWSRKIRLISTVLLMIMCLSVFGIAISNLNFNQIEFMEELYSDYESSINVVSRNVDGKYLLGNESFNTIEENYDAGLVAPLYNGPGNRPFMVIDNKEHLDKMGFEIIFGDSLPEKIDEIAITKKLADQYIENSEELSTSSVDWVSTIIPHQYSQFIGLYLYDSILIKNIKIVAIVDTHYEDEYDYLKTVNAEKNSDYTDENILSTLDNHFAYIASDLYIDNVLYYYTATNTLRFDTTISFNMPFVGETIQKVTTEESLFTEKQLNKIAKPKFPNGEKKLSRYEVLVDIDMLENIILHEYGNSKMPLNEMCEKIEQGLYINGVDLCLLSEVCESNQRLKVVGYYDSSHENVHIPRMTVNEEFAYDYSWIIPNYGEVASALIKLSSDSSERKSLFNTIEDMSFLEESLYTGEVENIRSSTTTVEWYYLAAGIGAVALIVMGIYIGGVIYDSRYKIGAMRAMGMGTVGVSSIYAVEAIFTSLIAIVSSIIVSIFLIKMPTFNTGNGYTMFIQVLSFGFVESLILIGIGFAIALIGIIIPLVLNLRKTPAQLLREK